MASQSISDTGISVVYQPSHGDPIVDIVLVHGLKGHPRKTWVHHAGPSSVEHRGIPPSLVSDDEVIATQRRTSSLRDATQKPMRKLFSKFKSPSRTESGPGGSGTQESTESQSSTFWPRDLLPGECTRARILVYGYDTKITKYRAGATNHNGIFSHARDFLFTLGRERIADRPLIFVAHSLGGIVVKEMLTRSSNSATDRFRNIVASTAAVIFLGTPHRGSKDLAALGEWARSLISAFRMETNANILNALGLGNSDLERAQESFSALWYQHDFRVKTFQEGLGMRGMNLAGALGGKVVPDYSSVIGDVREDAETMQASHLELCRFPSKHDPNYRKLASEIKSVYDDLEALQDVQHLRPSSRDDLGSLTGSATRSSKQQAFTHRDYEPLVKEILESLHFYSMLRWRHNIDPAARNTCRWLFDHPSYVEWTGARQESDNSGLLWLKGKPGSGKSVCMREAFLKASSELFGNERTCVAGFFFNAKGEPLERSILGMIRSLLYQLSSQNSGLVQILLDLYRQRRGLLESELGTGLDLAEAKDILRSFLTTDRDTRILLFIDSLDECESDDVRTLISFLRDTLDSAREKGVDLSICISSRQFPTVSVTDCLTIVVDAHNQEDIAHYIDEKLGRSIEQSTEDGMLLKDRILEKSGGVFLWVVLVVDTVLRKRDEGENLQRLMRAIDALPDALKVLYTTLLESVAPESRRLTERLFQWTLLSTRPLGLRHWHHILAFIRDEPFTSLWEWQVSESFTASDEQLEKRIRSLSKGLIEVSSCSEEPPHATFDSISINAGAGSLDLEQGETRAVQVIHESVRELFMSGRGFTILCPHSAGDPIARGHLSIMHTCLSYIKIQELDDLTEARRRKRPDFDAFQSTQPSSVTSGTGEPRPDSGRPRRPPRSDVSFPTQPSIRKPTKYKTPVPEWRKARSAPSMKAVVAAGA